MKKRCTHFITILLLLLVFTPKNLKAENGQMMFVAVMSTFNEIPQVTGDGVGLVTFLISENRSEVSIHGAFSKLTGDVMGCHIHLGSTDTTGPVLIDLSAMVSGNKIKGKLPVPSVLLFAYAAAGLLYINVHTAQHPAGEIRGQLAWMSDIVLPLIASGQDEVPPVQTNALGLGTFRFSQNLTRLDYQLMPINLSGAVNAAHIHRGDETMNGPVISPLTVTTANYITGSIEDEALVEEILFEAFTGGAYVNVHTSANPGGEIRGQLLSDLPNNAGALINGEQENPPVSTNAKGYGYASLDFPDMDSINYLVIYSGMQPSAAHIHKAKAGLNGPVIAPLIPFLPGVYLGKAAISADNVTSFMKDELYFNIHSSTNPGGEIRGQFENNLLKSYAFDLCGDQEVPAKKLDAYGAGFVSINKSNTEMTYGLIADGLSGDALAAHIHNGAFGMNGSVLLGLETPSPLSVNYFPISGDEAMVIEMDNAYMNVHTSANPGGEIRGQVRRVLSCDINVGTIHSAIQELRLVSTLIQHELILEVNSDKNISSHVFVSDISGKEMMQWKTGFSSGTSQIRLDVRKLSSGFYLLNMVDEHNKIRSLKFIKQ